MTVVDIHTHLCEEPNMKIESTLSNRPVGEIASDYVQRMEEGPVDHSVAIIMDEAILLDDDSMSDLLSVQDDTSVFSLAYLIDPLNDNAEKIIQRAAKTGAVGIKFHPYIQDLSSGSYQRIQEIGEVIEKNDLLTIVDCSYGSEKLYEVNGVELGHELARSVDSPVLLTHGGGPRILDAYAAADALDNVYLDSSLSLSYWEGSSIIQDFGFTASNLGASRFMWGSDCPYVDQRESLARAKKFANEYNIDAEEYLGNTAAELIDA